MRRRGAHAARDHGQAGVGTPISPSARMLAAESDSPFAGRVALVTGASGGIGARLSVGLARAGAAVAVHYGSNSAAAAEVAAELADGGGRAVICGADLRDGAAPERLVAESRRPAGSTCWRRTPASARPRPGRRSTATPSTKPWRSTSGHPSCSPAASCRDARARLRPDPVHVVRRGADRRHRRPPLRIVQGGPPLA